MILIKITKENREPEVGEWYWHHRANTYSKRLDRIRFHKLNKALSLSVILDAPEKWDNPYWKIYDEPTLAHYPISNSEEIFQWLHDQGKLGEEWVEWEGDHKVRSYWGGKKDEVYLPVWQNKSNENPLKEENCPNLKCDEIYTGWRVKLFTHMEEYHNLPLTDTELQDIYNCIIKFNPEKETRRLKN